MGNLENVLAEANLHTGYKHLTQREKKVIELYYLEGYRDKEIAKLYGITQQAISYLRKKGLNKLKLI